MILCQLAAKICAGEREWRAEQNDDKPVPKPPKALNTRGHNQLARENITKFIAWSTAFGVDKETVLFESEDLVSLTQRKHKALVLILDLARLAHHITLPGCIVAEREHQVQLQEQRKARKIDRAARAIQRCWRDHLAAQHEKELAVKRAAETLHLARLTAAAVLAQSWWRGHVARKQYASKLASVKSIQQAIRASLARAEFKKKLAAIQTIQNAIRMQLAVRLLAKKVEEARIAREREEARKRRAATVMQAGWRGRKARLAYAEQKRKVVAIQSVVRAFLARQQAEARRVAIVKMQSVLRMYLAVQQRKELEAAAEKARIEAEQNRSAVMIQSLVRMHLVKLQLPALREAAEQKRIAAEQARIAAEKAKLAEEEARLKLVNEAKARQLAAEQELARRAAEAEEARLARNAVLAEQKRLDALSKSKLENDMLREDRHTFKLKVQLRKVSRKELPKHVSDDGRASVAGDKKAPPEENTAKTASVKSSAPGVAPKPSAAVHLDPAAASTVGPAEEKIEQEAVTISGKVAKLKAGGKAVLDLNKSGVTDGQIDELVSAIKTNAVMDVHLDLEGNKITDAGAASLATLLGEDGVLASLKLGFNKLTGTGAASLAERLKHDSTLTALELTYNNIEDAGVEALAGALLVNSTLRDLNLYKCRVGDDGLWALAEALIEANSTLRVLALGMNRFGSGAFEVLCEAIRREHLEEVSLNGNDLRHDDAGCLADALRGNSALKKLDLRANKIGNLGAKHLAAALADECGVASVDIQKNKITSRGLEALINAGVKDRVVCEGLPTRLEGPAAEPAVAEPAVAEPAPAAAAEPAAEPAAVAAPPSKRYLRLKEKSLALALSAWQEDHRGVDHTTSDDWKAVAEKTLSEFKAVWDEKEKEKEQENDLILAQLAEITAKLQSTTQAKEAAEAEAAGLVKLETLMAESSALLEEAVALSARAKALDARLGHL